MEKSQIVSQALFRVVLLPLLCLGLSVTASAQSQDTDIRPNADQLTAKQIKKIFSNATMDGAYNFGRNGRAQSFYKEQHNPDGTLTYEEDGKVDPGRWFVRKDALCFTYPSNILAGGCFRVYHCLLYTSPSPRDLSTSRMPSSA